MPVPDTAATEPMGSVRVEPMFIGAPLAQTVDNAPQCLAFDHAADINALLPDLYADRARRAEGRCRR